MNSQFITGPSINNTFSTNTVTFDLLFQKIFLLAGLGAAFIYIAFAVLLFFRTQNLHRTLKTDQGELLVLLALANLIIAIIIGVLGFFIAVV